MKSELRTVFHNTGEENAVFPQFRMYEDYILALNHWSSWSKSLKETSVDFTLPVVLFGRNALFFRDSKRDERTPLSIAKGRSMAARNFLPVFDMTY